MGAEIRKGYSRRSAIPTELLRALNCGEDEPRTLAEWLAIDAVRLLKAILPEVGLGDHARQLARVATGSAKDGIMRRQRAIGAAIFEVCEKHRAKGRVYEALASHRSGVVREWAALMVTADTALSLDERLERAKRFAADASMGVREIAWMSYRPFLVRELDRGLQILAAWVRDADPNIRRCAIESTRPRGVWCEHITELKAHPEKALPLLEAVRSDPSRYVQLSAGNWLNDASKSQASWVRKVCARWTKQSPSKETASIVQRALRTLKKSAK